MEFKSERPIFSQLMERIQLDIITGRYQPGEKLPSVRDLAAEAAVNPNTMQKALWNWNAAVWCTLREPAAASSQKTPP